MKRKIIIIAAIAAATFTGCKKDSSISDLTTANAAAARPRSAGPTPAPVPTSTTSVTYQLVGGPQDANAPLVWNGGTYAAATDIRFSGQNQSGNFINNGAHVNITGKLAAPTDLGVLDIPTGKYLSMLFQVQLVPSSASPALELYGTYFFSGGEKVRVVWSVNEPLMLEGNTENVDIRPIGYIAHLYFIYEGITTGTDEDFFKRAERRDGVIYISDTENTELNALMRENIKAIPPLRVALNY